MVRISLQERSLQLSPGGARDTEQDGTGAPATSEQKPTTPSTPAAVKEDAIVDLLDSEVLFFPLIRIHLLNIKLFAPRC